MKKLLLLFSAFLVFTAIAQAPQKMSYQAVIHNASNQLLQYNIVGMRISIMQGASNGPVVYVETHAPTTNGNGLATIEIGAGVVVSGSFSAINWPTGVYWIKTEIDPLGQSNYTILGTQQ